MRVNEPLGCCSGDASHRCLMSNLAREGVDTIVPPVFQIFQTTEDSSELEVGERQGEGFPRWSWRVKIQTSTHLTKSRTQPAEHWVPVGGCPLCCETPQSITKDWIFSKYSFKSIFYRVSKMNGQPVNCGLPLHRSGHV